MQIVIALALIATQGHTQDCVDTIASTTVVENYQINDNGTVHDIKRGIVWMQCSVGQTWRAGECQGIPRTVTWENSLQIANASQFAGHTDWRLPTIYELSSISELRCQKPAIDLTLFPETYVGDYWSSTSFINNTAIAWLMNFTYGENHTAKKSTNAAVRLVRSVHR
ncbi:Lcl C-terminal domain-containing protein [Kaarinaea lacus]